MPPQENTPIYGSVELSRTYVFEKKESKNQRTVNHLNNDSLF